MSKERFSLQYDNKRLEDKKAELNKQKAELKKEAKKLLSIIKEKKLEAFILLLNIGLIIFLLNM